MSSPISSFGCAAGAGAGAGLGAGRGAAGCCCAIGRGAGAASGSVPRLRRIRPVALRNRLKPPPPAGGAETGGGAIGRGAAAALINVARMAGATIGVAILGAVFTALQGGPEGLRLAMLVGGLVQLTAAAVAWMTTGRGMAARSG